MIKTLLMLLTALPLLAQTSAYDFRHVRWGMSEEQVRKSESGRVFRNWEGEKDVQGNPVHIIFSPSSVAGINSYVLYGFAQDKLKFINIIPRLEAMTTKGQLEGTFTAFATALIKRYGGGPFTIGSDNNGWRHISGDPSSAFDEFYKHPADDMRETFVSPRTFAYVRAEHNKDETFGVTVELDEVPSNDF